MTVASQTTPYAGQAWRRVFADTLIRIQPGINPDAADELSDSAYLTLGTMSPSDAAALLRAGRSNTQFLARGPAGHDRHCL